jgi:hypothetical protein
MAVFMAVFMPASMAVFMAHLDQHQFIDCKDGCMFLVVVRAAQGVGVQGDRGGDMVGFTWV